MTNTLKQSNKTLNKRMFLKTTMNNLELKIILLGS